MRREAVNDRHQGNEAMSPLPEPLSTLTEFRCERCGKLLGKYANDGGRLLLEMFCRRCGSIMRLLSDPE